MSLSLPIQRARPIAASTANKNGRESKVRENKKCQKDNVKNVSSSDAFYFSRARSRVKKIADFLDFTFAIRFLPQFVFFLSLRHLMKPKEYIDGSRYYNGQCQAGQEKAIGSW